MKTFCYWVAECKDDAVCYSAIGRTRKECIGYMSEHGGPGIFEKPVRRAVAYKDLFDFFAAVTGEGGGRMAGYAVNYTGPGWPAKEIA